MTEQHFRNLEDLYIAAPINKIYSPVIQVVKKKCVITAPV